MKKVFKINELGRSMVEMLGVLAIIGVLSIGGIVGYSFAMAKYRANDIVYEVNMRATDIWHKYQNQPLPEPDEDGTDFDEWPMRTATSYPIYMTSHPDAAFKIYVEGVSSRVCKNVVNTNLNDVIQGIQFVQVAQGDGDLVKYTGDASICGEEETDNLLVFTSFLDSENETGEGQSGDPCIDDDDCGTLCGPATCGDDMSCHNSCSGTSKSLCYDDNNGGVCVECLSNKDCPDEQICDLENHKCIELPQSCGEGERFGKEYRAANGSCVSCDYMSEIVIMNSDDNDGIFEKTVGNTTIQDTRSGIAMCQACQPISHRTEEANQDGAVKTYCATGCVKGNSFLSKSSGCIPCNSTTETDIPSDDQSLLLCASCPNRVWYRAWYGAGYKCIIRDCPDGYFKTNGATCTRCDTSINGDFYYKALGDPGHSSSAGKLTEEWAEECRQCASDKSGAYKTNRHPVKSESTTYCVRKCGENQFQDFSGKCYDCTTDESPSFELNGTLNKREYLFNLCTSCTTAQREVKGANCVKVRSEECKDDEETGMKYFKGSDYKCYPCNQPGSVYTDTQEDCIGNCGEQRFYDSRTQKCYYNCGSDYVMSYSGKCVHCSDVGDGVIMGYFNAQNTDIDNICLTSCNGVNTLYKACTVADCHFCAPKDCGENKIPGPTHSNWSKICYPCPTADTKTLHMNRDEYQAECEACGHHMYINKYCVYMNPGVSGVCNNDSPDVEKYPNHTAGIGVLYRDKTGVCRRCDDKNNSYATTEEECNSCVVNGVQIRRLVSGMCVYGGCTEGDTFQTPTGCTSCSTNSVKVEVIGQDATLLCNSCNRRIMKTADEKQYCVQKCEDGDWQDINGDCWSSGTDIDENEIGVDDISAQLCRNASRTPNKNESTGRVYCIKS